MVAEEFVGHTDRDVDNGISGNCFEEKVKRETFEARVRVPTAKINPDLSINCSALHHCDKGW